jgi:hypothetical protein
MKGRSGALTPAEWLDVTGATLITPWTEKAIRARVARRQIPFRRLGSRIIFHRAELIAFLEKLDGVGVGEALANATRAGGR